MPNEISLLGVLDESAHHDGRHVGRFQHADLLVGPMRAKELGM